MTSLIGNVDAFTSFSFGTPSAPAPVNTGQTFTNNNPSNTPTFVNTNPQAGIDQETLNRIAFKDEENTFTKPQTVHKNNSTSYPIASTLDQHQDDIQDNKEKLIHIENTTEGLIVSSKVRALGFEIDDRGTATASGGGITDVKTSLLSHSTRLDSVEQKTNDIVVEDIGVLITRFNNVAVFMLGMSIADGRDISFDGDTTTLATFKSKIAVLETQLHQVSTTNITDGWTRTDNQIHLPLGFDLKYQLAESEQAIEIGSAISTHSIDINGLKVEQLRIANEQTSINALTQDFTRNTDELVLSHKLKMNNDLVIGENLLMQDGDSTVDLIDKIITAEDKVNTNNSSIGTLMGRTQNMTGFSMFGVQSTSVHGFLNTDFLNVSNACSFGTDNVSFKVGTDASSGTTLYSSFKSVYNDVENHKATLSTLNNTIDSRILNFTTATDTQQSLQTIISNEFSTLGVESHTTIISNKFGGGVVSNIIDNVQYYYTGIYGHATGRRHENYEVYLFCVAYDYRNNGIIASFYHPNISVAICEVAFDREKLKLHSILQSRITRDLTPTAQIPDDGRDYSDFLNHSNLQSQAMTARVNEVFNFSLTDTYEYLSGYAAITPSVRSSSHSTSMHFNGSGFAVGLNDDDFVVSVSNNVANLQNQINQNTINISNGYTKAESDARYLLNSSNADYYPTSELYTKTESDAIFATIVQHDQLSTTISNLDSQINSINNVVNNNQTALTNVYTKTQVDFVAENAITLSGFRNNTNNTGKTLQCDNVNVLRGASYLPVLTSDDFRELLINNVDAVSGTVQQNTVLIAGPNLIIPKSPNPIVFVDTDGRLGSSSLSESRYDDQVFGVDGRGEDGNETDNNEQKFQHGLVPSFVARNTITNERIGSSTHLLTASGTWRQLSDIFVENGVSTVSVSENLPDFQPITSNNKFAMSSLVNGGTIFYADIDTSFISEHSSRLYHTPDRVNSLINTKLVDGSITNAVINHLESQTLTAVSDRRLKTNIKKINKNIEKLDPVEFEYKNDRGKTRYGLIAQDVKKNYPELVETDINGRLSVKYLDIIGLLIKDNQELKSRIVNLELAMNSLFKIENS